jgi:hypothetical protein
MLYVQLIPLVVTVAIFGATCIAVGRQSDTSTG